MKNKWALATLVTLCWALAASSGLGYYYYQYTDLVNRLGGSLVPINLGIDYGNGTREWFNGTRGITLFDCMKQAGWEIETKSFPMGLYVTSINGVEESAEPLKYWGWWTWTECGWAHGGSACDKYIVSPNETILWYYSTVNSTTGEMTPPP